MRNYGKKKENMTYEEELAYLDSEISKTEETLKALKTRKKELAKVKNRLICRLCMQRSRVRQICGGCNFQLKVRICPDCEPAVWNRGTGSQYLFPVFLSYEKLHFYTIKMLREDCIAGGILIEMEEMVMGQERIIHAALLGAGTVGSGVYKLVKDLEEEIISKTGARLVVDKILVRDTTKAREGIPSELLIDRWDEILNDPKIEIVIEVMGGIRPALTWLEEALRAGKQVVTANKDLLAEYGEQLFDAAEAGKCDLHFEAAVAGAIPIIRPLRQSLAASELTEVMGIVNRTTNYILTRMTEDGMGYEEALARATKLGYAESDPTADVEGYDAGRKVAIMASIAFNSNVTFSQVYTEGITHHGGGYPLCEGIWLCDQADRHDEADRRRRRG